MSCGGQPMSNSVFIPVFPTTLLAIHRQEWRLGWPPCANLRSIRSALESHCSGSATSNERSDEEHSDSFPLHRRQRGVSATPYRARQGWGLCRKHKLSAGRFMVWVSPVLIVNFILLSSYVSGDAKMSSFIGWPAAVLASYECNLHLRCMVERVID